MRFLFFSMECIDNNMVCSNQRDDSLMNIYKVLALLSPPDIYTSILLSKVGNFS
jgi:hypothetical protein